MDPPEDRTERMGVRSIWQDEALDFTPWLAKNLDLLGEELGIKIELVRQEEPIGPFYLDILAREVNEGVDIAIENQLEWTDSGHLGQLLTYATGCDAHIAVWVAPEFRFEHARALHRLNAMTSGQFRFFGVRIEVSEKAGGSGFEATFRKVVWPGGRDYDIAQRPGTTMSPRARQFHEFFKPLVANLLGADRDFAEKAVYHFGHTGRYFPSRRNPGVGYAVSLEGKNDAWVTLHLGTEDKLRTKRVFDELKEEQESIESSIIACPNPEWHWRRHTPHTFSSVNVRQDGSIDDPQDEHDEIRAWMLDLLAKFKEVFEPRVAEILSEFARTNRQ